MFNKEYPYKKKEERDNKLAKMKVREYHFEKTVEHKISNMAKDLVWSLLEPDFTKRLDIQSVCDHRWFPIILQEAKFLATTTKNETPLNKEISEFIIIEGEQ